MDLGQPAHRRQAELPGPSGEALVGRHVPVARAVDDLVGQRRSRRLLVPARRRRRSRARTACRSSAGWSRARSARHPRSGTSPASAPRRSRPARRRCSRTRTSCRPGSGPTGSARRAPSRVERDRALLELAREVGADHVGQLLAADVLVVADLGLGRRREDRLRQPIGLAQAVRKAMPAHRRRCGGTPPSPIRPGSRARRTRRRPAPRGGRASSAAASSGVRAGCGSRSRSAHTKCDRPRSASCSNHQAERRVRTAPLSGIGWSKTTSKADRRSVATSRRCRSSTSYVSRTLPRWIEGQLLDLGAHQCVSDRVTVAPPGVFGIDLSVPAAAECRGGASPTRSMRSKTSRADDHQHGADGRDHVAARRPRPCRPRPPTRATPPS